MDLDFRLDGRGRYNLLDFNPRPGAQFRLFRTETGMDVVRVLHLDLTGRPVSGGQQIEGRTFMLDIQDVVAAYEYYRSGHLTMRDWIRSVRGIDERAWYAADDRYPFWLMSLSMPLRASSRRLAPTKSVLDVRVPARGSARQPLSTGRRNQITSFRTVANSLWTGHHL
jgi:D-aspartate ligase